MKLFSGLLVSAAIFLTPGCTDSNKDPVASTAEASSAPPDHYSMADFATVRKFDAHVHINVLDPAFRDQARDDNFELLAINVDYPDFPKLADQRAAALAQVQGDAARVHWATTFSMQGFGKKDWADSVKTQLAADAKQGAKAVKIWKNVGMAEKDASGKLIRIDDPAISPVAEWDPLESTCRHASLSIL